MRTKTNATNKILIYSLSLANWLCRNGHDILKVEDNEKQPKFKVFVFEDTPELHRTIARFSREV